MLPDLHTPAQRLRAALRLTLAAGLCVALGACQSEEEPKEEAQARPVRSITVAEQLAGNTVSLAGIIESQVQVDLAAWLRIPLPRPNNMGGIPLPPLDPDLMEKLAELEHRRWMVDRRLSGWRHGPARDNTARLHPDLIPYADLDDYTKELDRAIVREAWDTLGSARGSGFFAQGAEKRAG